MICPRGCARTWQTSDGRHALRSAGFAELTGIESGLTLADQTLNPHGRRMPAMQDADTNPTEARLRDVDLLARAAFTWVRQQAMEQRFLGSPLSNIDESELAAGFLAGLRSSLSIGDTESSLVAYAYTLMRGERAGALAAARDLVGRAPGVGASCSGFLHGIDAARRLVAAADFQRLPDQPLPQAARRLSG